MLQLIPSPSTKQHADVTCDVINLSIHQGKICDLQPQHARFGPEVTLLSCVKLATFSTVAGIQGVTVHLKPPAVADQNLSKAREQQQRVCWTYQNVESRLSKISYNFPSFPKGIVDSVQN